MPPLASFPADTLRVDFDSDGPGFYLTEFTIEAGGDVDARCCCRFIEIRNGAAVFAWVKGCPVHLAEPRVPLLLETAT